MVVSIPLWAAFDYSTGATSSKWISIYTKYKLYRHTKHTLYVGTIQAMHCNNTTHSNIDNIEPYKVGRHIDFLPIMLCVWRTRFTCRAPGPRPRVPQIIGGSSWRFPGANALWRTQRAFYRNRMEANFVRPVQSFCHSIFQIQAPNYFYRLRAVIMDSKNSSHRFYYMYFFLFNKTMSCVYFHALYEMKKYYEFNIKKKCFFSYILFQLLFHL